MVKKDQGGERRGENGAESHTNGTRETDFPVITPSFSVKMYSVGAVFLALTVVHLAASQDGAFYDFIPSRPGVDSGSSGSRFSFAGEPASFPSQSRVSGRSGLNQINLPVQQGQVFLGSQNRVVGDRSVLDAGNFDGFSDQGNVHFLDLSPQPSPIFPGGPSSFIGNVQAANALQGPSIIQQLVNPTVTLTSTVDSFETVTDLVLQTYPVTLTQFSLHATTRLTRVVVATPANNALTISTSVVISPTFVTITGTKSDFRLVVRSSLAYVTLTHTSYAITHVPFTITATETVRITSPVVSTVISTSVQVVTKIRNVTNTVYVHAGYH